MGFWVDMNSFCGIDLLKWTTRGIVLVYLGGSTWILKESTKHFIMVLEEDGFTVGKLGVYSAVTLLVFSILIPSALGLFGVFRERPALLNAFLIANKIFLGFVCLALVGFIGFTLWLLISIIFRNVSIEDDFIVMLFVDLVTGILLPLLYVITSVVHSCQRRS